MSNSPAVDSDLDADLLQQPIQGQNLEGAALLGGLLHQGGPEPLTLLSFVRHFG